MNELLNQVYSEMNSLSSRQINDILSSKDNLKNFILDRELAGPNIIVPILDALLQALRKLFGY